MNAAGLGAPSLGLARGRGRGVRKRVWNSTSGEVRPLERRDVRRRDSPGGDLGIAFRLPNR